MDKGQMLIPFKSSCSLFEICGFTIKRCPAELEYTVAHALLHLVGVLLDKDVPEVER